MTIIILDTNVVSELMKSDPDLDFQNWLNRAEDAVFATTVVTLSEITFGLARLPNGSRRTQLQASFEAFVGTEGSLTVFGLSELAAIYSGQMRARRQRLGQPASLGDMLIAGIAHANAAHLATRNQKDFANLGLVVINPWAIR